ncbi:MAG: tandem-95 repeat protein [Planctomycetaceae bacterium]|nr:tandem-95 repeat protein [Planctomycetaceae bacterium]
MSQILCAGASRKSGAASRSTRIRSYRCQTETLETRQLLAGDLVGQWVAENLEIPNGAEVQAWPDEINQVPAGRSLGSVKLAANQLGGRSVMRFDAAEGGDNLIISSFDNPLAAADDFSIVIAFSTDATDLMGGNDEWFKNTGLVDSNSLGFGDDWGLSINATGQVAFGMSGGFTGVSPRTVYSSVNGLNDGQLHIATATRKGSELTLQVDNLAADVIQDADPKVRASLDISLGSLLHRTNFFSGDIAEVRMYNGQLTTDETTVIYNELSSFYNNRPPVSISDSYQTDEDRPLIVAASTGVLANDIDADQDPLVAIIETEPSHGTVSLLENGSFFYVPERNYFGTDEFTYRAVDFRPSDPPATVTIEITSVHDAPIAQNDSYKTTPTEPLTTPFFMSILSNDESSEGLALTSELSRDVASGALQLESDGSFRFDPQGVAGNITFGYRANDGISLSNEATVTIVVNTPPSATADSYDVTEDERFTVTADGGVLANDTDADGDSLTPSLGREPSNGVLTFNRDGSFDYEANPNFFGKDEFTYWLSDGVDESEEVLVQLNIQATNDPPVASPDGYFALPGDLLDVSATAGLLANDTDIDTPQIAAVLVEGPQNGVLSLEADGAFRYTPNPDFNGSDQFKYRADDGTDQSKETIVSLRITPQPIIISEIMTSNATTISTILRTSADQEFEGETLSPDWIELRNFLSTSLDIGGMHLTDDSDITDKWTFPAGTILPADGYLLVFASGENILDTDLDQKGFLHTNFQLSTDGGSYLALTDNANRVIHSTGESYPDQRTHISFGVPDVDPTTFAYFLDPTPGASNTAGLATLVEDTNFSIDRGFFKEPFEVAITTATEGAAIRYTTDGTVPTLTNGSDYSSPLTISKTTTLRAAAFKDGMVPTNIDTHSYFFVTDVLGQTRQSTIAAGFPERWRSQTADYGIDSDSQLPRIAGDSDMSLSDAQDAIVESLEAIPSMSIVMNVDDMFGTKGIYSNPNSAGSAWERPTSVELLHQDDTTGFQIDAGIRIQGGAFRGFGLTRKKSFRLLFKSDYGPSKLDYPLFGADANASFDTLTLRMESNDGWQWDGAGGQPQYARDQYLRNTQLAMGQVASHGRSIHLYINGFYWGLYNIVERPDQSMGEAYFGSEKYNWDGINSGTAINDDGDRFRRNRTRDAWSTMQRMARDVEKAGTQSEKTDLLMKIQGLNQDGTENPDLEDWLDIENMIDYLLINYYGHNSDWPFKNFYVGRENSPDSTGFKFFMWDAEWSLLLRSNVRGNNVTAKSGVAVPFQSLRSSDEFRVMFGDQVQKHFFNGGVFYVDPENPNWDPDHPERNVPASLYAEWADQVYPALIAESARWGDQHRSTPRNRNDDWQREYNRIMDSWFPRRSANMIDIYQDLDLFPKLATALFNQRGGAIDRQFPIALSAAQGNIYYTTDGSDPRLIGGEISPTAMRYEQPFNLLANTKIKVRVLHNGDWSAIDEADFIVDAIPADATNLRISELHYHPANPTDAEKAAGYDDADDFEFIELVNISDQTIDLSNIEFKKTIVDAEAEGIDFAFAEGALQQLAPAARLVVVENPEAFHFRYGDQLPVAGSWSGGLSNRSETITIKANDQVLQSFRYEENWHETTDGTGPSLEIINAAHPDLSSWGQAASWRPSAANGGSPGTAEVTPVIGDSNADGVFDSGDLVAVFRAGEYEDSVLGNSSYAEGDWNADGDFDSGDLVFAFQNGNYVSGATPLMASPQIAAALLWTETDHNSNLAQVSNVMLTADRQTTNAQQLPEEIEARELLFALDERPSTLDTDVSELEDRTQDLFENLHDFLI